MKTIRQIADEIGVSKQAIQKRLSREPLYTCIQPYISTKERTKYISVDGENLIKQAFSSLSSNEDIDKVADNLHTPDVHSMYTSLQQELEHKNKMLEEQQQTIQQQQKNINDLTNALNNMTVSLQGAHALHAGTMTKQISNTSLTEDVEIPIDNTVTQSRKTSFFDKLNKLLKTKRNP